MKKQNRMAYLALGIIFIVFNVLAFAIPTEKTGTFWTAYVFTVLAFAAQIGIWRLAFGKAETLKSKFLGIPLLHVGVAALSIQLIAFAVFMAVPSLPAWAAVVTSAIIFGGAGVCLIAGDVGRDEVERVEEKVNRKVFYLKDLQADIELLAEQEADPEMRAELLKLAEAVRFSDPMSNAALADIEAEIAGKVAALKTADHKAEVIAEVKLLLAERNKKAKLLK